MPAIVVAEFMDEAAIADLARRFATLYDATLVDRADALRAAVHDCRALIVRNRTQVRGELLAAARHLEVVGRLGVGLDNIDLAACRERGIEVCPAAGANDASVAEYVVCGVMMLLRGAYHASVAVAAGDWPRERLIGREIAGRRLGLVGFGAIARETAARARALGMTVAAHDPFVAADDPAWRRHDVQPLPLPDLLASVDALSLHVPLTDGTRRLIDAHALARLQPGAVLVNAARGGVLDEAALADALRTGRLAGAMLDVFEHEPLAAGGPLAGIPNLILTPHIAGVTQESNVRVGAVTVANVLRVLERRP